MLLELFDATHRLVFVHFTAKCKLSPNENRLFWVTFSYCVSTKIKNKFLKGPDLTLLLFFCPFMTLLVLVVDTDVPLRLIVS